MTDEGGDDATTPPDADDAGAASTEETPPDTDDAGAASTEETPPDTDDAGAASTGGEGTPPDVDDAETEPRLDTDALYDVVETAGRPIVTASVVARHTDLTQADAAAALDELADAGDAERVDTSDDPVVYYPQSWGELAERERLVVFPDRREIVADRPTQYTRAGLAQFAHLVDSTRTDPGTRGYLYEVRPEDVWAAPYDSLEELLARVRSVLPRRVGSLEEWIGEQWKRANQFVLRTHEDGYVVLEAAREELMGNVARQKLSEEHLRAPISDTESWVNADAVGAIKRTLYEAGYPVRDERELDSGDPLDVTLETELREYQREWVDRFLDRQSGVLVAPPGSGKTVAALGVLAEIGGETLILVPSRELAGQWRAELLAHTDLDEDQVGEYHGGTKQIRPVTIATYQIAGMDRHRSLFDSREWGLIVFDEVHHVPADVARRTTELQSRHRLGTTASAVREDDREEEIFTLVGPPLGTDWGALFDAGHVVEPEVEIRYVPWRDDEAENEWAAAERRAKRQLAATNPAKVDAVRRLREEHPDARTLVFVDYLDQGESLSASLGVPFVSGETRHHERERLFEAFRQGERDTLIVSRIADEGLDLPNAELAIVASGLGGSRRQGTQRAGRTMRPSGSAVVYVLATRGTSEEEFARRRMQHLSGKGVRVRERTVE
ncbi:DEAD/DEAH box helicase family protein [Halobaculum sp. MBLA0147]|uniref:DEAD/DEAH box helicase family protein n=1 Tax=Halobaculum sp. MBLA0147 TaxID=3079934 RepID=UPI0035239EC1